MSVIPTDAQLCNEKLLSDLLNENTSDISPQSRNEAFLLGLINKVVPDITPVSRVECYLKALCEKGVAGGLELDDTLSASGKAADAAVVGERFSSLSEEKITSPETASVGQTIKVKAIDENGKPIEWEPCDFPEQVQADWNQNDRTAEDHVKNRPFWTGDVVDTVLLDETELTFKNGVCMFDTALQLTEGDTYIVTYNGVVYECVAWGTDVRDDHRVVVGNGKFIKLTNGNGEPFVFVSEGIFTTDTSALVKIVERHQEIHKIDTKYLPSTIPYMVDDKIPSKYVQEQFPNVKDVFGSGIVLGGDYSTLANPYPNKLVLRDLTLEKFNAMADGTENLPSVCLVENNLACVMRYTNPTREIHVTWVEYSAYGIAGYNLAGAYIILYEAIIHEDTDNPGVVVSEYAMIKVADKPLS